MYKVDVPPFSEEGVVVEKFEISPADAAFYNINCHGRPVSPGQHTRLVINGRVWMSDTDAEMREHRTLFWAVETVVALRGEARVLLNGLGLGMALHGCFQNGATHVTAVEKHPVIAERIGGYWSEVYGDKLTVHCADAFEWNPPKGTRYHMVWHDIWQSLCGDNLKEMERLHRKYGRRTEWQQSWGRQELKRR
jgi:hypothetical protein